MKEWDTSKLLFRKEIIVNMSKLRDKVERVVGTIGIFGHAESIAVVGETVNKNADVLEELIDEVDKLKEEVAKLKAK